MASAIALPDRLAEDPPNANPLKRSEAPEGEQEQEQANKRQRISPGKNPSPEGDGVDSVIDQQPKPEDATATSNPPGPDTRPARRQDSGVPDEKQRSKRLFGALLGNLNQSAGGDRTTKRRQEIESRRKAELQRQDDALREDKLREQERLAEIRRKEQIGVDEENMRFRHSNTLHTANFLQTTAEPRLYYRPWDLRADEEDRIEQQVKDAQARIAQELDDFDELHPDRARRIQAQRRAQRPPSAEEAQEDHAAKSDDSKPAEVPDSPAAATNLDTNHEPVNASSPSAKQGKGEELDEDGDHVVDADEDTVIY